MTGPIALREALDSYMDLNMSESGNLNYREDIFIGDSKLVYPYSWEADWASSAEICSAVKQRTFNETKCKERFDPNHESFAITYWSHSWGNGFKGDLAVINNL